MDNITIAHELIKIAKLVNADVTPEEREEAINKIKSQFEEVGKYYWKAGSSLAIEIGQVLQIRYLDPKLRRAEHWNEDVELNPYWHVYKDYVLKDWVPNVDKIISEVKNADKIEKSIIPYINELDKKIKRGISEETKKKIIKYCKKVARPRLKKWRETRPVTIENKRDD